jgi:hypothetical protein
MSLNISHNIFLARITRLESHDLQMDFAMPFAQMNHEFHFSSYKGIFQICHEFLFRFSPSLPVLIDT